MWTFSVRNWRQSSVELNRQQSTADHGEIFSLSPEFGTRPLYVEAILVDSHDAGEDTHVMMTMMIMTKFQR